MLQVTFGRERRSRLAPVQPRAITVAEIRASTGKRQVSRDKRGDDDAVAT
jgi:hypothetical protein